MNFPKNLVDEIPLTTVLDSKMSSGNLRLYTLIRCLVAFGCNRFSIPARTPAMQGKLLKKSINYNNLLDQKFTVGDMDIEGSAFSGTLVSCVEYLNTQKLSSKTDLAEGSSGLFLLNKIEGRMPLSVVIGVGEAEGTRELYLLHVVVAQEWGFRVVRKLADLGLNPKGHSIMLGALQSNGIF